MTSLILIFEFFLVNKKKPYIKPQVTLIDLDQTITLMMISNPIWDGTPKSSPKGPDEPFKSPFGDKPFS